ncbi:chitin binding peritrophin-A domain-containing protein [Streptomyces albidoflavus]
MFSSRLHRVAPVAMAALFAAAAAVSPANAAQPPAPSAANACPAEDPGNAVLIPRGSSAGGYAACSNGSAYAMPCPSGLLWNAAVGVCDYPANSTAAPAPTRITATEPARINSRSGAVTGLTAVVTWGDGQPLYDAPVRFTTAGGTALCTAHTDQTGRATCSAGYVANVTPGRFTATYDGTESLRGSTGQGTILAAG